MAKTASERLLARKLAGKIMVLKNDETVRKEEKIVLIPVLTDIDKKSELDEKKINEFEIENIYNILYQALIIPQIKRAPILDLTLNKEFQSGGEYLDENNALNVVNTSTGNAFRPTFTAVKDIFLNNDGNGIYKKEDYFTFFAFDIKSNHKSLAGCVEVVGVRNVILLSERDNSTLAHEAVHGLGLHHTHREHDKIKEINRRYIFKNSTTTNIISYAAKRNTSWHWQWQIINPNISSK